MLQKLSKEKKKYIDTVSTARKKLIIDGIKDQRKIFEKVKVKLVKKSKVLVSNKLVPTIKENNNVKRPKIEEQKNKVVEEVGTKNKKLLPTRSQSKHLLSKASSPSKIRLPSKIILRSKVEKNKLLKSNDQIDMSSIKAEIEKELHSEKGGSKVVLEGVESSVESLAEQAIKTKEVKLQEEKSDKAYLKTGVPGFDNLYENGIPRGNVVIVAGGAGSGKTIFCLQTIYNNAIKGKKCFYMSFEESEERLVGHMKSFGWDASRMISSGKLKVKRYSPFEVTRSVEALLAKEKGELLIDVQPIIIPKDFKPDIIVLDSLTAIASAFTGKDDSYRIYIEQLFHFFEKLGATAFLITETKQIPEIFSTTGVEEFLADGVIVFYNIKRGDIRENAVEVLKMSGEKHQKKIVAMQITEQGIIVYPEQEVFGGIE